MAPQGTHCGCPSVQDVQFCQLQRDDVRTWRRSVQFHRPSSAVPANAYGLHGADGRHGPLHGAAICLCSLRQSLVGASRAFRPDAFSLSAGSRWLWQCISHANTSIYSSAFKLPRGFASGSICRLRSCSSRSRWLRMSVCRRKKATLLPV